MSHRRLTIVSWNIRRCIGADGRGNGDRIARVLKELDPDVVALQEVDSQGAPGQEPEGSLESLGTALGMKTVAGPAMRRSDRGYGNGLLTRLAVVRVRRHDLSFPGAEPRGALEVELGPPLGRWVVLATHLGLRHGERLRQVDVLLRRIRDLRKVELLAVMGDFNEWWPRGPVARGLGRALGPTAAPATFPSRLPVLALDRVWIRPAERLERLYVHRSGATRRASDHLPLVAVVRRDAAERG